jgi:hypothetical protein
VALSLTTLPKNGKTAGGHYPLSFFMKSGLSSPLKMERSSTYLCDHLIVQYKAKKIKPKKPPFGGFLAKNTYLNQVFFYLN